MKHSIPIRAAALLMTLTLLTGLAASCTKHSPESEFASDQTEVAVSEMRKPSDVDFDSTLPEKTDQNHTERTDRDHTEKTETDPHTENTTSSGNPNSSENDENPPTNPSDSDNPNAPDKPVDSQKPPQQIQYGDIPTGRRHSRAILNGLKINGTPCIYDESSNTYLYAVSASAIGKSGIYSVETASPVQNVQIQFRNGELGGNSRFTPTGNQTIEFRAYTDSLYAEYQLRISTIPLLSVETESRVEITSRVQDRLCTLTLLDPDYAAHGTTEIFTSSATIRIRGATSANYSKKPYKIELQKYVSDASGNQIMKERNASLLGMRSDDDWHLDAMYLDPTLMHNKLSYALWDEIGGDTNPYGLRSGPRAEYVEVILNGSYNGLYLLVEPVDEKQAGVEKLENTKNGTHGVYYKTTSWTYTKFDTCSGSPFQEKTGKWGYSWGGFELKYPETGISEKDWEPLMQLMDATVYGSDSQFSAVAGRLLDKKNIVNYWILISATHARDNAGKNICWTIANTSKPNFKMYINAWDLDNTFGYRYGVPFAIEDNLMLHSNYADGFVLLRRYLKNNVDGSAAYLQTRWAELSGKNGPLSVEQLNRRLQKIGDILRISGAYDREQQRWPDSCPRTLEYELNYTQSWICEHIPKIDAEVQKYRP